MATTLQCNSTKKAMATIVAFFSLLRRCAAAQLHKEGDDNCRRLLPAVELHCSAAPRRRRWHLSSPSSYCGAALQRSGRRQLCCGVALQRNRRRRLCYGAAQRSRRRQQRCHRLLLSLLKAQLHEEGNDSCRHLLLLLFCSFFSLIA